MNKLALVLAMVGVLLFDAADSIAYDRAKFCATNAPKLTIFLDLTTPYDEQDKQRLSDGILRIVKDLRGGEHVTIRTIVDSSSRSATLINECMPFCPEGGLLQDMFSDCTGGLLLIERKRFESELIVAIREATKSFTELPRSDILQTLYHAGREEFHPGRKNVAIIFSDMIEHSEVLKGKDYLVENAGRPIGKIRKVGLLPDWRHVEVSIFGIGRGGGAGRKPLPPLTAQRLENFWRAYFHAAGVAGLTISQNYLDASP